MFPCWVMVGRRADFNLDPFWFDFVLMFPCWVRVGRRSDFNLDPSWLDIVLMLPFWARLGRRSDFNLDPFWFGFVLMFPFWVRVGRFEIVWVQSLIRSVPWNSVSVHIFDRFGKQNGSKTVSEPLVPKVSKTAPLGDT